MSDQIDELLIENATILFPNFAGKASDTNAEGNRNFCVLLNDVDARNLTRADWNVKYLRGREDGEPDRPFIQVTVGYKIRPPLINMITSRGRTNLTQEMVDLLDTVDYKEIDMIVRGVKWERHGRGGIKAYLKTLFVTINEDYLELKYADIPLAHG